MSDRPTATAAFGRPEAAPGPTDATAPATPATPAAPLVRAVDLARTFDVSAPWLNRVLERKPRLLLHAVDGVQ